MHGMILLLLILVPAPRIETAPAPPHPLIGAFAIDWGSCQQTTFFNADGTCWSPEYGAGTWEEYEGAIWFSEQDGRCQYVMVIDLLSGEGVGNFVSQGQYGGTVEVRIRKGERLPLPRPIE